MKKNVILFLLAVLFCSTAAQAQFSRGNSLLGLSTRLGLMGFSDQTLMNLPSADIFSLGFSSIRIKTDKGGVKEPDPDKLTSFTVMPKFGYFITDGLVLGADLSYSTLTYKSGETDIKVTLSTIGAGPFLRYYLRGGKVTPFLEGTAVFGSGRYKENYNSEESESKISLFAWGAGAGIAIPLGDRAAFDLMAGYISNTVKDKENNDDNWRTVTGTLGFRFGFTVLLGKVAGSTD